MSIDNILKNEDGTLRVLPASEYLKINKKQLDLWALENDIYCFPTQELIDWLRDKNKGYPAIEICAGHGSIGRALGIISTDSYAKKNGFISPPKIRILPPDVKKYEAKDAIKWYKPKSVIGSYVPQKFEPGEKNINAHVDGVDEQFILSNVFQYIHIGDLQSHSKKRIFDQQHESYYFEWLVTRATHQDENRIWIWRNHGHA